MSSRNSRNGRNMKKSYGIMCFKRDDKNNIEFLMVKKSKSYCFCKFIQGRYKNTDDDLMKLFNNMTFDEKMDIRRMEFDLLWYKLYLGLYDSKEIGSRMYIDYTNKKKKFESLFIHDKGKRLMYLMNNSDNVDTEWEFPKGKRDNHREKPINTAIREFYEETKISSSQYRLLWHVPPYVETYDDFDVTYQNIYYYAEMISGGYNLDKTDPAQIREIRDITWMNKTKFRYISKICKWASARMLKKIDIAIKKYKKNTKLIYGYDGLMFESPGIISNY